MYTEYILIYIFGYKLLQGTHTVIKANIEKTSEYHWHKCEKLTQINTLKSHSEYIFICFHIHGLIHRSG